GLAGEEELLDAGACAVDRPGLAVAQRAAHHRVSLVRRDDLQLARLAAEDLRRRHGSEELALDEMVRAAEPDLFTERPEQPERAPGLAPLHPPHRFRLAQRIQLHVRHAEAVKEPVALRQGPG